MDCLAKDFVSFDDEKKMLQFLKQYLIEKNYHDALICLEFAMDVHKDQFRDGGKPYIVHPLFLAIHSILNGLEQEEYLNPEVFLGAALDHDTIEDHPNRTREFDSLPISSDIKSVVHTLDKTPYREKYAPDKKRADEEYYQGVSQSLLASRLKMEDRLHNFRTMRGTFDTQRKIKYLQEFYQRYPTLMKEVERAIPRPIPSTHPYQVLKSELYHYALLHERDILKEIDTMNMEMKQKLLKEIQFSRTRKIA